MHPFLEFSYTLYYFMSIPHGYIICIQSCILKQLFDILRSTVVSLSSQSKTCKQSHIDLLGFLKQNRIYFLLSHHRLPDYTCCWSAVQVQQQRRIELWECRQGRPSQPDLLYLHPGSLLLNISVYVFAPRIAAEWSVRVHGEDMNRFGAEKGRGRQSVVMTVSTVTVCSLSWCVADLFGPSCRRNFAYSWAIFALNYCQQCYPHY